MVLDILAGAMLLAFGILVGYFAAEPKDSTDGKLIVYLLISLASILAGGWIILTRIGLATLLMKIGGLVIALVGFFLAIKFPDTNEYQAEGFTRAGMLIGLVLLIFGVYLLFFA